MEAMPAALLGAAIVNGCRQMLDSGQSDMAFRALSNLWTDISSQLVPYIKAHPAGRPTAAAVVLESYFATNGDWKAMERKLIEVAEVQLLMPASLLSLMVSKLGKQFADVAKTMTEEARRG
jgi:hypothetical protein